MGPTIEWRVTNAGGSWKPFATILGFFTGPEPGATEGQVLVVTRIEPGATCHVAYVDALANADADELARDAADRLAPVFDCKDEPQVIGRVAAWQR